MKKVYIVISVHGSYEDYRENIEGVFWEKEDAEEFAKAFDDEHVIDLYGMDPDEQDDMVYNIMPQEIYINWPYDEAADSLAPEYEGYTRDQYDAQDRRISLLYMDYGNCHIEEHEVK